MTTEYLDASNSLYSSSFESIKRRRLISDDYKNSDIDCENLMDYSGDNFPSELSAKASSSSIQESITNMSNSHSTPEDTFSEIALSSPSSKHCKPDNDSKDFDQSSDHYNLTNATIHVNVNQTVNELIKPSTSSSNNLKSIDDTIELVLSKIREENNFSKNLDVSQSFHQKCEKSNYANDILNSASNNTISRASSFIVGSRGLENISYSKSGISPSSCLSSSISNYTAALLSTYSKSYSQQLYNYNNNYGVPPRMAANFSNTINASNYTDYGKIDYSRSNNYTIKEIDKSSSSKYNYYPYQLGNQAPSPFRQYLPANSYLNQSFYNPDNQSQTVTTSVIPIHNNPNYQMFQKSIKRNSYFDQIYIDDEVNHIYNDTSKSNQSYNIYFKTPQSNVGGSGSSTIGGTGIGLMEQTSSIRKKRINTSDINKITPTKKRKITNQFSSMTTNSYDELLRRLKVNNYNTLLMNPTVCQSNTVLSPKGFVENSTKIITLNTSLQFKKYCSSLFKINKPKSFEDVDQEDKYLSLYINNNISTEKTVDQKKHMDFDELFEIVCSSPDTSSDPSAATSHLHHLTVDDNNCDPKSPELFSSFSKQKRKYQNAKKENVDIESSQLNYNANYFITPIVSYSENETKLITELHPMKSQELIRNYTQLSGSFLKRTKINGKSFSNIHIEEAVSIASLSASKNQNSCFYCYAFLNGLSCIRKNGKSIGLESSDDFLFCSTSCYSNFKSYNLTDNLEKQLLNNNINLTNNLKSTKVLIKSTPYKPPKNYKKVCDFEQYVRRRFPSEGQGDITSQKSAIPLSTDTKKKRLLGVNYYFFKNEPMKTIYKDIEKSDQNLLLKKYSCSYQLEGLIDQRLCILCRNIGDGDEDICGRLINIDSDNWVHLNCALWCFEVFETVSGSLMEVQPSLQKAIKTICSFCNKSGAGIQCYRSKCTCVYHVPCAYKVGCIFYTDRGMYCPNHVVLNHPMHLPLLRVERRVNILRDESALIAGIVAEDQDVKIKFRTGSLTLNSIGQLLPEQLISGNYNSNSIIYPVGYHATRIYWSSTQINKRCKYECIIDEEQDMPLFKVKFIDSNGCEKISTDRSCDRLWKSILNKIAKLRQDSGLTRLFPLYMSGEQLYGLTEPQIIRVIESLPGVEMVKNYAFKFGKMQLITEMPLAINPSGCARSEPKLRTYVRRFRDYQDVKFNKCGILKAKSSQQAVTMYESGLNKTALLNSKTLQYKRLKYEWMNNVILSRSKIQGLGLFAAKDFEKSTMIIEYIGEIIRNEVGNAREKQYQSRNNSIYMFRLNEDLIIDATVNGGLARYINHSCNPNCVAETLSLDCGSRIIITTRQMIERGEELTYDYKFDFEDNKADRIPCLCGSINCRKWMN